MKITIDIDDKYIPFLANVLGTVEDGIDEYLESDLIKKCETYIAAQHKDLLEKKVEELEINTKSIDVKIEELNSGVIPEIDIAIIE